MKNVALALVGFLALAGCDDPEETSDAVDTTEDAIRAAAPLGAEPKGTATSYPIVLAHGFLGSGEGFASFHASIGEALAADGHVVVRGSVPPLGNVRIRAQALARDVDDALAKTGAKKVNIIAHSMGGLDARDLVSGLGYGDRVASITTISTPHRGSRIADVSQRLVAGAPEEALDAFGKLVDRSREEVESSIDVKGALRDLSEANAASFAALHPDDARVYYQSWAGVSSLFAIPNPSDAVACEGKLLAHQGRADLMSPLLAPAAPIVDRRSRRTAERRLRPRLQREARQLPREHSRRSRRRDRRLQRRARVARSPHRLRLRSLPSQRRVRSREARLLILVTSVARMRTER